MSSLLTLTVQNDLDRDRDRDLLLSIIFPNTMIVTIDLVATKESEKIAITVIHASTKRNMKKRPTTKSRSRHGHHIVTTVSATMEKT